ncbi:Hypothetical protein CINCED_3A014991 [Cinara cedri]|nr:Hypothetical protein CINCED_3A014991 [Cinara cedri]
MVRANCIYLFSKVYPLEKREEMYDVSATFLIRQQNALMNALSDSCYRIQILAIKGISMCMRKFWNTFNEYQIIKCFEIFLSLIEGNNIDVRKAVFHGFTVLLDITESHIYFKNSEMFTKTKQILMNENEKIKVRRSVSHFLLKVKKVDSKSKDAATIKYEEIVNLQDISIIFDNNCEEIRCLLVDLIFDYFYGDNVQDENVTIMRLTEFYKINKTSFHNMIFFTKKTLNFNNACKFMLMLLRHVYCLFKKAEHLEDTNIDYSIRFKKLKINSDSENIGDINTSSVGNDDYYRQNKDSYICCILDCVNCLIVVHDNTFTEDCNRKQFTEIQDLCISCIIGILKFHKNDKIYVSTMCLAALFPISKIMVHTSAPSTALSTLKQFPNNMMEMEETNKDLPVCITYALSMWNQSYKIIQIVTNWFEYAFKTLDPNATLTFRTKEKNVFETNSKECKPKIGNLLITCMLTCNKSQQKLRDSGINEYNVHEMILCLEKIKPTIENRMFSDDSLNNILTDEVMIELFYLYMKLPIIYYNYDKSLRNNKIIDHQMSVFDWILEKLLVKDLQLKCDRTKIFIVRIIKVVNNTVYNYSLMKIGTHVYLNKFFIMCSSIIDNNLGEWILLHMIKTLGEGLGYLYYLENTNSAKNDVSTLNNCVVAITNIVSFFEDYKSTEEDFIMCFGEPKVFLKEFCNLILELKRLSAPDFHQVFLAFIETIMVIIDNEIRKINSVDLIENPIIIPFSGFLLIRVILNNLQLLNYFSDNIVQLFSSPIYQNDCIRLLSAINFIFNVTFHSRARAINFAPILKVLFKMLTKSENNAPLSAFDYGDCNFDISIFEVPCSNNLMYIKAKGRDILVNTAKKLHLTF